MGLFNFGKKKEFTMVAPLSGKIIELDKVEDPVFSQKMMGDGFAISPSEGKVFAPFDGQVVSLFPTNHAVGIKAESGEEVLIHIGLDTVNLKGQGFTSHVKINDKVKTGDLLIEFDLDQIKEKVPSIDTPIVFTDLNGKDEVKILKFGAVNAGDDQLIELK